MKFGMVVDLIEFFKKFVRQNCSTTHRFRDIGPQSQILGGDRGVPGGGCGGVNFQNFQKQKEGARKTIWGFQKIKKLSF